MLLFSWIQFCLKGCLITFPKGQGQCQDNNDDIVELISPLAFCWWVDRGAPCLLQTIAPHPWASSLATVMERVPILCDCIVQTNTFLGDSFNKMIVHLIGHCTQSDSCPQTSAAWHYNVCLPWLDVTLCSLWCTAGMMATPSLLQSIATTPISTLWWQLWLHSCTTHLWRRAEISFPAYFALI